METSLSALPEELIVRISDQVSLDSLVQFVLACRVTYRCARPRMIANQHCHEQEQRAQHDRLPLTVPSLLRRILQDPDASFHLRTLEFWGVRPGWQEWTTWDIFNYQGSDEGGDMADPDWPEPAEDQRHLDSSFFEPTELRFYADCMRHQLRLDPEQTRKWMSKVEDGWDEPLKVLLIALSPRLRRLNFIAEYMDDPVQHPLGLLTEAISRAHHLQQAAWPPGFMALRSVSVNTSSGIPYDGDYAVPSEVAPLFILPNIRVLNLALLWKEDPNPDFYLPRSSSGVDELTFHLCEMSCKAREKLLLAPRELRRLRCKHGSVLTKKLTGQLAQQYASTLEELLVYGENNKLDDACLRKFEKLALLEGVVLSNSSTWAMRLSTLPEPALGCASLDLRTILPFSLQQLTIKDYLLKLRGGLLKFGRRKAGKDLLHGIADLAEDARFEHLREVCFWGIDLGGECDEALMRIKASRLSLRRDGKSDGKLRKDDYLERRKAGIDDYGEIETSPFS